MFESGGIPKPPIQPPDMPSLSGMMPGVQKPSASGALPRLIFQIENLLDSVAAADPTKSQKVDEIKGLLRELMTSADFGGANGKPSTLDTGSMMGGPSA